MRRLGLRLFDVWVGRNSTDVLAFKEKNANFVTYSGLGVLSYHQHNPIVSIGGISYHKIHASDNMTINVTSTRLEKGNDNHWELVGYPTGAPLS